MPLKMKKSIYKSGLFLITALFLLSANLGAQEAAKEYHEEFAVKQGATLDLSNRYGNITIQSWDQDKIVVDVKVTIEMSDKNKAQDLLQYINVQFGNDNNVVSAKTVIDDKFNMSGWGNRSKKFSIVYKVKMPIYADLKLENKYGNTDIDALDGHVDISVKYGDIVAGKLSRGDEKPLNSVSASYGKISVDEAGWLDIYARYSPEVNINRSKALLLDAKYSKVKIGEASSLVGESKYGSLSIDRINNLVIQSGYDHVKVGTLIKSLEYRGSYSSLAAESVPSGFESITVESKYTGVQLGIDESASYKLDARVSYGGLKINEDNFKYTRRIIENTSNETSGIVGKDPNPTAEVNVNSSYGSVRLY
jgi:uncharacterized protein YneR